MSLFTLPTSTLPAAIGYSMPAEWERHASTWLAWPHKLESWPGRFELIPPIFARFVKTLARFERVNVLAGGTAVMAKAQGMVGDVPNVTLHDIPTNDAWVRDHGPTFLVGLDQLPPALVDWQYNAWGGKYPPFDLDNDVPRRIAEVTDRQRFSPGIVLEGGAIDTNGRGTFLTTEQCLLNPNRNPKLSRTDIEQYLAGYLGAKKILWLGEGIEGDDTDGHIDELARFVGPRTVVAVVEEDPADANYRPLQDNYKRLQHMTDEDDRPLEIVPLPMPRPMHYEGQRIPGSYCNFYLANGVAVVPEFGDPSDARVNETLAKLLPDREIVAIPARDLFWGLGAFHCLTQQEPA
ncbi:MAG: agmatine deiminase family protein [Pirellulales bacterium]|nr:agmatine deiminase family protein [Pirellulales bacterium]